MTDHVKKMRASQARKSNQRTNDAKAPEPVRKAVPRLPDASVFQATYDATTKTWSGLLSLPNLLAFRSVARTLFTLCSNLDALYRKHLKEHDAPKAS